ncbi:MAG: Ig-like domain-containing protein [Actinomycetota bacterium]
MKFDDSADIHNISMGWYDPVKHATSGDPLYGGNVPYSIDGLWVTDRLAQEFRSFCSISVPDYVGGSDGSPGAPVAARAASGADGDLRFTGCPTGPTGPTLLATAMTLALEGQGSSRALVSRLSVVDDPDSSVVDRTVDFYADGLFIGSATTDASGRARLVVPPRYRGGSHAFEARFAGDDEYGSSSATTDT